MKIKDSEWGYSFDDNVNMFSWIYYVSRAIPSNNTITLTSKESGLTTKQVQVGDEILFYDSYLDLASRSKVLSVSESVYRVKNLSKIAWYPSINYSSLRAVDIVVDVWPRGYDEDTFDRVAMLSSVDGSGFDYDNCTVLYSTSRTIGTSHSNGIIRNSHIEGGVTGGIVIGPQFIWNIGGFSSNITMINNTFVNSGHFSQPWIMGAAINIMGMSYGQYNLSIINNTFIECPIPNIMVTGTTGTLISGNVFKSPVFTETGNTNECGQDLICLNYRWNKDSIVENNFLLVNNSKKLVQIQTNPASKSWKMSDTIRLKDKTLLFYPESTFINLSTFESAVDACVGNFDKIKIQKGNYSLTGSLNAPKKLGYWVPTPLFASGLQVDFSGSFLRKLFKGPLASVKLNVFNYTLVSNCSECYPYKMCDKNTKSSECCYCGSNDMGCENSRLQKGLDLITSPLPDGIEGPVPSCPCYPYTKCPSEGFLKSESYKYGLCYCETEVCKELQASHGYNIRHPITYNV